MGHSRIARLGLLVAALTVSLHALDLKSLKPQGYVSDFAGVVDPTSRAAIAQYAGAVERATGAQMSFVTLKTLDGDPLEDVSIDLFRQFGVGQKGKDNGVQLLLVVDDRRSRLEVGNALEPILPDGLDGQILLDMRPQLRAGNYGQAMLAAAERIGGIVAKDKNVTISTPALAPVPPTQQPQTSDSFPWFPVIFVVILLIGMFRRGAASQRSGGGFWPGFLIGSLLSGGSSGGRGGFGGSGSGGSSGGFGGSDSGGFGGFGGGDAGGGGASSSW